MTIAEAQIILNGLLVVGTFLLALIAIFHYKIKAFFYYPALDCTIEVKPPDCHRTTSTVPEKLASGEIRIKDSFYSYYFLFKIWNKGTISARNAEVIISDVYQKVGDNFKHIEGFLSDNLLWSFLGGKIYCDYISPDTYKHCNLGHIHDPKFREKYGEHNPCLTVDANETIFCFDVHFKSNKLYYLVPPGVYKFKITVGCENSKSISKEYIMEITGKWNADETRMLNEGFLIKEE